MSDEEQSPEVEEQEEEYTVEKVVDRGARLDDLETRSQNLQEATIQFQVWRNNPDCNGAQSAVDGVKGPG